MDKAKFVILTAARNESLYIRETLESVLSQSVLPLRWVIVCNNSTDETESIAREYAEEHSFISVQHLQNHASRNFSAKVESLSTGYESIRHMEFEMVGNLDADITLPRDYYERLLHEFDRNPRLGTGGGIYLDQVNDTYRSGRFLPLYPPGAAMVFRRTCYEEIGGFPSLSAGGEDSAASAMARMRGWDTASFPHLVALHRRPWGTGGNTSILKGRSLQGLMDYHLGMHPLYAFAKAARRLGETPVLLGSMCRLFGYLKACKNKEKRQLPDEVLQYLRKEQLNRLRNIMPLVKIKPTQDGRQII